MSLICSCDQEGKLYCQRVTGAAQRPRLSKRMSLKSSLPCLAFPPTLLARVSGEAQCGAYEDRPETPDGKYRTNAPIPRVNLRGPIVYPPSSSLTWLSLRALPGCSERAWAHHRHTSPLPPPPISRLTGYEMTSNLRGCMLHGSESAHCQV